MVSLILSVMEEREGNLEESISFALFPWEILKNSVKLERKKKKKKKLTFEFFKFLFGLKEIETVLLIRAF